jgi:hypothetical protein
MSIASKRAKATIRRALLKAKAIGSGRYDERVADVAAPMSWDQAQVISRTPGELRQSAQELRGLADEIAALAGQLDQDRACPKCEARVRGEIGAAATLRCASARLTALANQQIGQADQVDDAADRIGAPGATLWYGKREV